MKELTLKQIADWCGGTVAPEYETVPVTGVESDSRKVEVGDLFVALRGERVDGHDFIPSAKTLGASAALVSRPSEELPCVVVESPLRAYGEIAKHYREMTGVKVVGIDGTPQGIEGLKSGKLYGTVQCDSDEYAEVIFEIAAAEALGQNVQEKVELEEGTYYQCSQKALTVADLP